METDRTFSQIFTQRPDWLGLLSQSPMPPVAEAGPKVFKPKTECDLVVVPEDSAQPCQIWEFQFYFDHSVLIRTDLARLLEWRRLNPTRDCRRRDYVPREVTAVVVFSDRSVEVAGPEAFPHIRRIFLNERLVALERDVPVCPLVSLLRPMVEDQDTEVETKAAQDYAALRASPELDEEDQDCFTTIFVQLLMQRFKKRNSQDIHAMIQDLPPVEETCAGRELIEKGIEKGIQKGQRGAIQVVLEARFGVLPGNAIEELGRASGADRLASLQRTAALCASLDEFMAVLRQG